MEQNIIEIHNLTKSYKMYESKKARLVEVLFPRVKKHTEFKALDNLDLNVQKGEILGILGRNGAGKSTLLKIITGVAVQTSGDMKIEGKISSLLELGTAFNPELTGEENIYQHAQVMGLSKKEIELKKQEIIDFADIGEHLSQPVKTYSSGMFARLAFACAINVDPDILIVDEVLSVGDMAFQLKCFKKFEEFKKKGKTILFVTHNVSDVLKNCTRSIILQKGEKIFDGDVKEGVELYKKLITGTDIEKIKEEIEEKKNNKDDENGSSKKKAELSQDKDSWKIHFNQNPNIIEYGNKDAEVIDYGIFDENDNFLNSLDNDREIKLKSKIKFNKDIDNPIFTMTIKNFNGVEIAGTNSMIEKIYPGNFKKGDIVVAEFKQKLPIAPGGYTLSFSCTRINSKGELEVLNRKYEALLIEIMSNKDCVGMVRLDTKMKIEKKEK